MTMHAQFSSPEIAALLAANGIRDLDDAFRVGEPVGEQHIERANRHVYKHVVRLALESPRGVVPVYIKRQWRREKWLPRLTDIRHRTKLWCSPRHEWGGLRILQAAGLHVSEPLAVFWSGLGLVRGAVITRGVPPKLSIADMLEQGALQALPKTERDALLQAAVDVVVRLQQARIAWRSMKAKHFYPERLSNDGWRIWLIDCEGVSRWASGRDLRREWKTFAQTVTNHSPELRSQLLERYARQLNIATIIRQAA